MNNTDQAFIEAYRDRRETGQSHVRVMKVSEVDHVVGANSPIELDFAAPSQQIVLESSAPSAAAPSPFPMNRKHAKHPNVSGPHFAAGEATNRSADTTKEDMIITNSPQKAPASAEDDRAIQNAVAAGNELAVQSKIGNERLSQLLSQNQKTKRPADQKPSESVEQPPAPSVAPVAATAEAPIADQAINHQAAPASDAAPASETAPASEATPTSEPGPAVETVPASEPAPAITQTVETEIAPVSEPAPIIAEETVADTQPAVAEPSESEAEASDDDPAVETKVEESPEPTSAAAISSATDAVIEPAAKPELDPMWEVDSFVWPDVCNHIQQAGEQVLPDLEWVFACQPKILAIGSVSRQGGATTAAICLGRHIAEAGKNVLVIDANFESPTVAEQLGVRAPCCWRDKLIEGELLGEASITSIEDRMTLMPLFAGDPPPAKFADSIQQSINANVSGYDLAIIDIGVIDHARETDLWSTSDMFGGLLVVRDMRHDGEAALASAIDAAEQCGTNNVAVIENFTD